MNSTNPSVVCSYEMPAMNKWWFVVYDLRVVFTVIHVFLISIWALEKYFASRDPWKVQKALVLHNLFSTSYSGVLFYGIVRGMMNAKAASSLSMDHMLCDDKGELYEHLGFWIHIFYLSKYYELIDTFFLVVRKKNVPFLHLWHHSAYLVICYYLSTSGYTFQFVAVLFNSFVHFVMYLYYCLCSTSLKPHVKWIAKNITTMQMIQFVAGNVWQFGRFYQWDVLGKTCSGSKFWAYANAGVTVSFLYLFGQMYVARYQKNVKRDRGLKASSAVKTD